MTATLHIAENFVVVDEAALGRKENIFTAQFKKGSYRLAECPEWHRAVTASTGPRLVQSADTIPSPNVSSLQFHEQHT